MKISDIKRAKELSKQLETLGYKNTRKVTKKKIRTPYSFPYEALKNNKDKSFIFAERKPVKEPPKPKIHNYPYRILQIKNGRDGKDALPPSSEQLKAIIEPLIKQYHAEIEATKEIVVNEDLVKEIIKIMHSLPENDKLEVSKGIRNAQSFIFGKTRYDISELMHGGASSSSSSTDVYNEVVAGSGTSWTLSHSPTSDSLQLYANGQRLMLTTDYTISGANITTVSSWVAGTLLADYVY